MAIFIQKITKLITLIMLIEALLMIYKSLTMLEA